MITMNHIELKCHMKRNISHIAEKKTETQNFNPFQLDGLKEKERKRMKKKNVSWKQSEDLFCAESIVKMTRPTPRAI